ncbi:MAG: bifunctional phosphoglucose/phosphomannose isomerase [Candidatus Omnitrophica bacterium]|nr:bifunctional phosphoglucose/phosphomannose isomerase [Candidatus Omnitrophota bacterium]MCM8824573.1 bifunctional phosphoglucose/phosphomannose isomerase [Candidatus Omnitrophota bacterium]
MILENRNLIEKIDKSGMLKLIESFDMQCIEADSITVECTYEGNYNCIVFAGMGGSAIAGDILKQMVEIHCFLPFIVHRNYGLPGCVNEKSLVLAVSYSGDTEETLSAFEQAVKIGARVVSLSSGGKLEELSKKAGTLHIKIPSGQPPRCSLGYIFFPIANLLKKLGHIKNVNVSKIVELARTYRNVYGVESRENKAKEFARLMHGKNIFIYSGELLLPAATRWKTQIAENSKQMVSINVFPEMNHNEIMAWNFPLHLVSNSIVFFLRDPQDNERVKIRMSLTGEILKSKAIPVYEIESQGIDVVERIFSLILLGDWVSFYLAILNGVDPTEIREITYLKKKLVPFS